MLRGKIYTLCDNAPGTHLRIDRRIDLTGHRCLSNCLFAIHMGLNIGVTEKTIVQRKEDVSSLGLPCPGSAWPPGEGSASATVCSGQVQCREYLLAWATENRSGTFSLIYVL